MITRFSTILPVNGANTGRTDLSNGVAIKILFLKVLKCHKLFLILLSCYFPLKGILIFNF